MPMSTNCYLDLDEKGTIMNWRKFRGLIGSLLYSTTSWPDIIFSLWMYARYQSNSKKSWYIVAKKKKILK